MSKSGLRRIISGGMFLVFLVLPASGLAMTTQDEAYVPASLIGTEITAINKYGDDLKLYVDDCESQFDSPNFSGDRIKRCLTVLKELKSRAGAFTQNVEAIITKIKRANKWDEKLDREFEKNAAKLNADAAVIAEVRSLGGFRAALQVKANQSTQLPALFDRAIGELEALGKKSASSTEQFLQVSYRSATEPFRFCGTICADVRRTVVRVIGHATNVLLGTLERAVR